MRHLTVTAALACILDQASKLGVLVGLDLKARGVVEVLPPLLVFRYGENSGINFGLLESDSEGARWALVALSMLLCLALSIWLLRRHHGVWMHRSGGLTVGGALGNAIDRAMQGHVTDFLNMSCCGIANPYVFNLADIFIFAGVAGLLAFDRKNSASGQSTRDPDSETR